MNASKDPAQPWHRSITERIVRECAETKEMPPDIFVACLIIEFHNLETGVA